MSNTIWNLDPTHSELTFKVKHLMISNVKGEFTKFNATIEGDTFENSKITATVDAASVFTNNTDRDGHLKSADFFEVETYPSLKFESTSITKEDEGEYTLIGELTIKGTTKTVELDVEFGGYMKDPYGNQKAGFSIEGKINRKDFGLNWNAALETGGVLVSDDVKITAEVQFAKTEA
ncbi:YceI family protein [Flagellimonas lutimaris]|uniref:YceI family protein n=1 Tax=Flagellimonas lutimaris TaxID=475082 RepID=UPI000B75E5F5|nr:MAG: polyisoprenoid-binding protein [Muricauda sp. TMED12]|tara:strand:+ start:291610 stop:292140 length:531 start_codon:yes stop_codon:yes gene_type:complete